MQYSIEQTAEHLWVRLQGEIPPGSAQNEMVAAVVRDLRTVLETSSATECIVDCRELHYVWGDAIASIWLTALRHKLRCRIRATGVTKERLEDLIKLSIPIPISD